LPAIALRPKGALRELAQLLPDAFRFRFSLAPEPVEPPCYPPAGARGLVAVAGIVGDLNACLCLAMESATAVRLFSAPIASQSVTRGAQGLMDGLARYAVIRLGRQGYRVGPQGQCVIRVADLHEVFTMNVPVQLQQYRCPRGEIWQSIVPPTM
jgi:hypothetical protein